MFLSLFVSSIEATLMTIEASNVIAMRLQMIGRGDGGGLQWSEGDGVGKATRFLRRRGADIVAGVSNSIIRKNFRTVTRANEVRLNALRSAAWPPPRLAVSTQPWRLLKTVALSRSDSCKW
jgi:hypothetical protein